MAGCGHTQCQNGKRVSVKLKNGDMIRGKFWGKNSKTIQVGSTKIRTRDIRSFMIDRWQPLNGRKAQ